MAEKLSPPKNRAVDAAKVVLDALIEGVGVDAAVAAGIAAWPFLGSPIIKTLFRWGVEWIAGEINENLFKFSMKLIIRIQSDARKAEFNEALQPIIGGSPTDEEIQKARDAADRIIERNR